MADKARYQSWNPLNYSQNLCVVSNPTVSSDAPNGLMASRATDSLLADTMAALDMQNNKMVNELIASNDVELAQLDCTTGRPPTQSASSHGFQRDRNSSADAFDCGDFGLNSGHKLNVCSLSCSAEKGVKRMDGFSSSANNQLAYNQMQCIPDLMSSQNYSEMQSLPQPMQSCNQLQQPMSTRFSDNMGNSFMNPLACLSDSGRKVLANACPTTSSMTNPLTNQLINSLTSNLSQSCRAIDQTLMASNPSPSLPYIRNQSFQLSQFMEVPNTDMPAISGRPVRSIRARNVSQSGTEPINKLNHFFEKCCEQFKLLEKERKKIESELIQTFVGQKISSANNIPIQRVPQNASKVDRIITDMYREHAKVITIVAKMEQLRAREFNEGIHNSIQNWYEMVRLLQMKRKYEVQRSASQPLAVSLPDDAILEQMSDIMKKMSSDVRSVRTSLWSSLVVTLYDQTLP